MNLASTTSVSRSQSEPANIELAPFNPTRENAQSLYERGKSARWYVDDSISEMGPEATIAYALRPNSMMFDVLADGLKAGFVGLFNIRMGRSADLMLHIWDSRAMGDLVLRQVMLPYFLQAVDRLKLRRISFVAAEPNHLCHSIAKRAGFTREGRMRDSYLIDGQWHDGILWSILAHEIPGQEGSDG